MAWWRNLSPLATLEVEILTISSTISHQYFINKMTLSFQCRFAFVMGSFDVCNISSGQTITQQSIAGYLLVEFCNKSHQITKFMGPTWGLPGSCRPQIGPCWPQEPCYQGLWPYVPKSIGYWYKYGKKPCSFEISATFEIFIDIYPKI